MVDMLNRGSEWRKWDLHTHTKDTNKNDNFTSETFDDFCNIFFKRALEKGITAIGITDYFCIENYRKIKKFISEIKNNTSFTKDEKEKIKRIFLLPNVELRMMPSTDSGSLINIHFIFNPKYESKLDNNFFASIEFLSNSKNYKMNKAGLIELGKSQDSNLDDDDAYTKGVETFVVSHDAIQKLLNSNKELKENSLIIVSNSSNDGVSAFQEHHKLFESQAGSLDAVRSSIYKLSNIIFSGNPSDKVYFLGNGTDSEEEVIRKCGSLKPCIHGCDAHKESKLFLPNENRYCWIKSDLTFNGLKQIIYEPEARVRIQEDKPEEKLDYQTIDSVKFIEDDSFFQKEILLSENLSVIIGGKSTGKSLLLRSIANTIDPKEVQGRLDKCDRANNSLPKGFQIKWKDGSISKLGDDTNPKKKITYIPQTYLNKLADISEEETAIDEIIINILNQRDSINILFKKLNQFQETNQKEIILDIQNLVFDVEENKKQEETIKTIGDKEGIEKEIKKLIKEIDISSKKLSISKQELDLYKLRNQEIDGLQKEVSTIDSITSFIENNCGVKIPNLDFSLLPKKTKEDFSSKFEDLREVFNLNWGEFYALEKEKLIIEKQAHDKLISDKMLSIKSIKDRVDISDSIKKKTKTLDEEKIKLNDIESKLKAKEYLDSKIILKIQDLLDKHNLFYTKALEIKNNILEQMGVIDDLNLDIKMEFKSKDFIEQCINNFIDNRTLSKNSSIPFNSEYSIDNDPKMLKKDLSSFIPSLLFDEISLKKNQNKRDVLIGFLDNWWIFDYKIESEGDNINEMSPGKKSFVLLKLLINYDKESKYPILLDQPEDDLDNRSIYNELAKFIKEKKRERQIIIVSHNPNLVIGTDAEEIIVANQDKARNNTNKNYQFEYISGAIENSSKVGTETKVLYRQGIKEHVCEIMEGGESAFNLREQKYGFNHNL